MPLITGKRACTKAGIRANIAAEQKAGKSHAIALAIALDVCSRSKKKHKKSKKDGR